MQRSIAAGLLFLGAALQAMAQSAPLRWNSSNPQTDPASALEILSLQEAL